MSASSLHGSGPPLDEEVLLTREELPTWVRPDVHHASNVSFFFCRPTVAEVWQAVFAIDAVGAMFLDLTHHTPKKKRKLHDGDTAPLPGCVLIAVGVEQIRRARAGR